MVNNITREQMIAFEDKIGNLFNQGKIKAPIHLYHGNEELMLEVFDEVDAENDWICCTWRNHYQGLLKGIPQEVLEENIVNGKSMVMNLPEYKFICSSIVSGIAPIAVGIAYAIKLQNKKNRVWCWVGDMSAETGVFHEAYKYSVNHNLPITFIVEDNSYSVCTPTSMTWARTQPYFLEKEYTGGVLKQKNLYYYKYSNTKYPHAGAGVRVKF
jgi:TPP-dependent pyruvate/acetoin dehydrogenase alpha subunit